MLFRGASRSTLIPTAIAPLETIRQTLMTHLWPGMVRKPLQNGRAGSALPAPRDVVDGTPDEEEDEETGAGQTSSTFPIAFDPSRPPRTRGSSAGAGAVPMADGFPGLAELKAQIEMDEFERFERIGEGGVRGPGGMGRLDLLDEMLGQPGEDEYARLDEWLDEEDEGEFEGAYGFVAIDGEGEDGAEGGQGDRGLDDKEGEDEQDGRVISSPPSPRENVPKGLTFEDDFDDFAAFQSAPSARGAAAPALSGLAMDPTPLLLHLQSVRAELAGLDEEERRVKAGREVARVMRDLGFDDLDATDLFGDDGEIMDG